MLTWRLALLLTLTGTLCLPAPVSARPAPRQTVEARERPGPAVMAEARRRFSRGNQLYRQGSYAEALLAYQAALDLYAEPVILYNLAQTYEKLRDPARAALFFERYLQAQPRSPEKVAIAERIARLKQEARVEVAVTSYPPGAAIFVGSRQDGVKGRTPFQLRLPLGKQRLIIELSGFLPVERVVEVRLGEANLVDAQLQRRSSVRVDADQPGAVAFLEQPGRQQSQRLPHLFEVEPGPHQVTVELAGFQRVRKQVQVQAGEQVSLLVNLQPLPRYGRLQVLGSRTGQVLVEGKPGALLPMAPLRLVAGSHRITVQREGHRPWESRITVEAERLTVARVNLTPLRGTLTRSVLYGSAGLSAGALIAGGIFGALALSAERDYNRLPEHSKRDDGKTKALVADICFALGGAAALAAVVTYFATERGPSTAEVDLTGLPGPRDFLP